MQKSPLPFITIGIPVYNEGGYLAETIESALNQSYPNIKILISDNCSSDNSFEIAKSYAAKNSSIELVKQPRNIGANENFKYPLLKTDTKYFMWLGAHDLITTDYIKEAVSLLESESSVALAYPGGVSIDQEGNIIDTIKENYDTRGLNMEERIIKITKSFHNGYIIHGVFRSDVLKQIPLEKVVAADLLIVLSANFYGSVARLPIVGFKRRVVRKETFNEQLERHHTDGVYHKTKQNPYNQLSRAICKNILKAKGMLLPTKVILIFNLMKIFKKKFGVSWEGVLISEKNN